MQRSQQRFLCMKQQDKEDFDLVKYHKICNKLQSYYKEKEPFLPSKCTKMAFLRSFARLIYGKQLTKQRYFASIAFGFEM